MKNQPMATCHNKKTLNDDGTFTDTYTLVAGNRTFGTAIRAGRGFAFTPANGTAVRDNHKIIPTMAGIKLLIDNGHFDAYAKASPAKDAGKDASGQPATITGQGKDAGTGKGKDGQPLATGKDGKELRAS